jgi:hypothetical protein
VSIQTPVDSARFATGSTAIFAGAVADPEDGTGTTPLVWTSSLDGQIGTGGAFSAALSNGTHVITATMIDADGNTGGAQVTVVVGP